MRAFVIILRCLVVFSVLAMLFTSCASKRTVEQSAVRLIDSVRYEVRYIDSVRIQTVRRDSVYLRDSIVTKTIYREPTMFQEFKMRAFWFMAVIILSLVFFMIKRFS